MRSSASLDRVGHRQVLLRDDWCGLGDGALAIAATAANRFHRKRATLERPERFISSVLIFVLALHVSGLSA